MSDALAKAMQVANSPDKGNKDAPTITTDPVHLVIVASEKHCYGWHFKDKLVNLETKEYITKWRSPSDEFTYLHKWFPSEKLWAHLLYDDHKGFCTLRNLAATDNFAAFWNNEKLVASIKYVRDSVDGPEISEEEAFDLNDKYKPQRPPEPPEPSTTTGMKRRRTF